MGTEEVGNPGSALALLLLQGRPLLGLAVQSVFCHRTQLVL